MIDRCHHDDDGTDCDAPAAFRLQTPAATRGACLAHLGPLADALLYDASVRLVITRLLFSNRELPGATWADGEADPHARIVHSARQLTEREIRQAILSGDRAAKERIARALDDQEVSC